MKKLILSAVVILFASAACVAQKDNNFKISIGPELAFTTGSFSNSHSFGFGGTAQVEIPIQDKLQGVAYGGVMLYNGKSVGSGVKYKGVTIIPVRVGVKYYLTPGIYGGLQVGLGFLGNAATGTAFSYSPQVGYEFQTNNGKGIDVGFKYDAYSKNGTLSSFGFRVGFVL